MIKEIIQFVDVLPEEAFTRNLTLDEGFYLFLDIQKEDENYHLVNVDVNGIIQENDKLIVDKNTDPSSSPLYKEFLFRFENSKMINAMKSFNSSAKIFIAIGTPFGFSISKKALEENIAEQDLVLESQGEYGLDGKIESGIRVAEEDKAALSEIIELLNKRFGTEFNDADRLYFDQIEAELVADEKLSKQAKNNTIDNFKFGFDDIFMDKLISRMEQNQDLFTRIMDDKEFGNLVKDYLLKKVYHQLQKGA